MCYPGSFLFFDAKRSQSCINAGDHTCQLPGSRRQYTLVKIIEIKIYHPVVSLVGAEIFQVQVSADPAKGILRNCIIAMQIFKEQMTGTTEKPERVRRH